MFESKGCVNGFSLIDFKPPFGKPFFSIGEFRDFECEYVTI